MYVWYITNYVIDNEVLMQNAYTRWQAELINNLLRLLTLEPALD